MGFQISINFIIAIAWMFMQNSWDSVTFLLGYILAFALLFLLRRFLPGPFYFKTIKAIVKLLLLFFRELVLSNIAVIKQVISPKLNIRPGIFAMPIELEKDWEITTLSFLITLTPGTVTVDVSEDNKILYIHAMDIETKDQAIDDIKNTFEKAIMEVSRSV